MPGVQTYSCPVTATIPKDAATALGLLAAGDEVYLEVTAVNADGSVEVFTEAENEEEADTPEMKGAMSAIKRSALPTEISPPSEPAM